MGHRTLIGTALLLGFFAQAQAQTYDLSIRPVKGQKTTYALTFDIIGQSDSLTVKAKLVNEVVDVKTDGSFIMASYQSDHHLFVNEKEQTAQQETITGVTTYDKLGRPISVGGDQAGPETMRIAKLTSYIAPKQPVKVGGSWSDIVPKDDATKTPSVVHDYTLKSVETQNGKRVAIVAVKTSETADENPGSTMGTITIDLETGLQIRYEVQVRNFPIGEQLVNGKVTLVKA